MARILTKTKNRHLGPVMQKTVMLLLGGIALGLTTSPKGYSRLLESMQREWKAINRKSLQEAIRRLYQSKLIDYKENADDTVTVILTKEGKKIALTYNLEEIKVPRSAAWDKMWRMVIFDIPEYKKKGRDALAVKLKQMGFYPMQKSVFVHPFPCEDEINFILEIFDLKPFVRILLVKKTDVDLHLKTIFGLK